MIMVFLEIPLSIFNLDLTFEKNGCMCIRVFTLCFSISVIILSRKMACQLMSSSEKCSETISVLNYTSSVFLLPTLKKGGEQLILVEKERVFIFFLTFLLL